MKRFWISWTQLSEDYRPLQDPPQPDNIKGWWCSGQGIAGDYFVLCAVVDAKDERQAERIIKKAWDSNGEEVGEFRFVTEKPLNWLPSDRFPITHDWQKKRLGIT